MQKETERLPKILVMLYTCTFLVLNTSKALSRFIRRRHALFENGYRNTDQKKYFAK